MLRRIIIPALVGVLTVFIAWSSAQGAEETDRAITRTDKNWFDTTPACDAVNSSCDCAGYTATIFAGQTIPSGTLNVTNSDTEIIVTIETTAPWVMGGVHIYAEKHLRFNGGGNVPVGQFQYGRQFDGPTTFYTESIPLADLNLKEGEETVYIGVHTGMNQFDAACNQTAHHSGWAEGPIEFPGSQWGWFFCYQLLSAETTTIVGTPEDSVGVCGDTADDSLVIATTTCNGEVVDVPVVMSESFTCGEITRTWSATCGGSSSTTQVVSVEDSLPPSIIPPADRTIECDTTTSPPIDCGGDPETSGYAFVLDDCDPDPILTYADVVTPGACPQESVLTRTWTATDNCGNQASVDQTITVVDTTAPSLNVPGDATIRCDEDSSPSNTNSASGSDNCDAAPVVRFTDIESPGSCPQEFFITRTWTITDACGNSSTGDQIITVVDDQGPETAFPSDMTVECDPASNLSALDDWLAGASGTDACGAVAVSYDFAGLVDTCGSTGTADVEWTIADECGNSASSSATFTIEDKTGPNIQCPESQTLECDGSGNSLELESWLAGASADDTCGSVTLVNNFAAVTTECGSAGSAGVAWTATDDCGNESTCSANFSIVDTAPPSSVCPEDMTVQCDGQGNTEALNNWLAGASGSDLCSEVTTSNDLGGSVETGMTDACGAAGSRMITWTNSDACQNTSSCSASFVIEDTIAPELTIPDDILIDCGADVDGILNGDLGNATAFDGCDAAPEIALIEETVDGNCANSSTLLRTFTARDACGNETSATQTVRVGDATPPNVDGTIDLVSFKRLGYIWSPNHALTDILLTAAVDDECDAGPLAWSVMAFSDEDDDEDTGSGTFSPDAKYDPYRLRKERSGTSVGGDGRVYLLVLTAEDCAGNVGAQCVTMTVPIDQKQADIDNVMVQAEAAQAACQGFVDYLTGDRADIPLGYFEIGEPGAPVIGNKQ
jgi:hypothetical protein